MLRCLEIGLRPCDLHDLDYGMIQDILIEHGNDEFKYEILATQQDFDSFQEVKYGEQNKGYHH